VLTVDIGMREVHSSRFVVGSFTLILPLLVKLAVRLLGFTVRNLVTVSDSKQCPDLRR